MSITIDKCRVCGSDNLTNLISLGDQYLSDFRDDDKKPAQYPLDLLLCHNCFLVQLRHNAPQSLLYSEHYGYKSGINQTMRDHLKEIATKSLKKLENSDGKIVCVDIGANDGTLLKNYPKEILKIGVEPVQKLAEECKKYADIVINDFFNYASFKKQAGAKKADIVTIISCFYDMEEPNEFISDVVKILKKDGIVVIQQNYVKLMLEQNAFDNIVHEHLEYYSLLSLQNLLARHGLEVFDVEVNDLNGGSFRTYIARKGSRPIAKSVKEMEKAESKVGFDSEKIYKDFVKKVKKEAEQLYAFIKQEVAKGKKVYLYGASTRGNTLLQFAGLDNALISAAVERNPEKWGKKIASVSIPIISEEQARKEKPDYMLVLPWFFKEEFLKREKKYLENGGHFIFPLPKFEIV